MTSLLAISTTNVARTSKRKVDIFCGRCLELDRCLDVAGTSEGFIIYHNHLFRTEYVILRIDV